MLLDLVPEGAQIVAGIEDPHYSTSSGRLLLVTHSCNLDFKDWEVGITGVDPHRESDEVIEVATSSPEGELKGAPCAGGEPVRSGTHFPRRSRKWLVKRFIPGAGREFPALACVDIHAALVSFHSPTTTLIG
jgi:hypothetical protein